MAECIERKKRSNACYGIYEETVRAWQSMSASEVKELMHRFEQAIQTAPTADVVEVVHGRWEYLQDDEWRCSNCHTVFNTGGKWIPMTDNFCSECGADMRERRDDNAAD